MKLSHNDEIEQSVIGALIMHNSAIDVLQAELRAEHFYAEIHGKIYDLIRHSRERGEVVSLAKLKGIIPAESHSYLVELVKQSTSVINLADYAASIVKLATRRVLQQAAQAVIEATDEVDNAELVSGMACALDDANKQSLSHSMKSDRQVAEAICEELKRGRKFYPTGLSRVDSAMQGGLQEGRLYGIAADSGHGKTMLACTISNHLKRSGAKHLYICAEMGEMETHSRSMAMDMGADIRAFNDDSRRDFNFWNRLGDVAVKEAGNVIYYSDPFLTFDTLRQVITTAVAKYGIKGFILDYWQLVGGKATRDSDATFLGMVAQWQAAICKRHGLFGVNTAQLNRDGVVLGSGGLQRACDQMYFLLRPDETEPFAYLEMKKSRYTPFMHVGGAEEPSLQINGRGGYFMQVEAADSREAVYRWREERMGKNAIYSAA